MFKTLFNISSPSSAKIFFIFLSTQAFHLGAILGFSLALFIRYSILS